MNAKTLFFLAAVVLVAAPAVAQNNPECLGSSCGKPKEVGGGCGCGCGCSVWVAYTDDGTTLAYTDDADGDGKADTTDNCPFVANRDQADSDGDGVGDACDNCPGVSNFSQLDTNGDHLGDACDGDIDGDGIPNAQDNCPNIPNADQKNFDGDTMGDVCDADDDNDGVPDISDQCPFIADPTNNTSTGVGCSVDTDGDGMSDSFDNCPLVANNDQQDTDGDGIGDACDKDIDNDGILNEADNCQGIANRDQGNDDGDRFGDACDSHYCVVVSGNPDDPDCLDPNSPFHVSGGGAISLKRNEKFRLPLFANRNGAAIEYTWTVSTRPSGSKAAIENPAGYVTMSRHWAYAYTDGNVPTFTADVDGEYTLQLQAHLAFPDRAYPDQPDNTAELHMTARATGMACSAIPVDGSMAGLGFALLALVSRRRRS